MIMAVFDMVIPIPFTALILIYVVFEKPPWFINWVTDIYKTWSKEKIGDAMFGPAGYQELWVTSQI